MTTVADVLAAVDEIAPFRLAEAGDNVGLLLGDAQWPVRRVLVSLDITEAVLEEAERLDADCLLAHHPLIFKSVDRLTGETVHGWLALRLVGGRRACLAAHTNLDAAEGGLCDLLAHKVGLADLKPLGTGPQKKRYKVVVFVPESDLEPVRSAAFAAGAGRIGPYSECSFSVEGAGAFLPGQDARPTVGAKGARNSVREHRLEVMVEDRCLGQAIAAITRAHSYETPAIDVYPLEDLLGGVGLGRIGRLEKPKPLADFADDAKRALGLKAIHIAGESEQHIERVAVLTGSGSGLVDAVSAAGCQAYLTGELKYHEVLALAARGIAVILAGHYETERVALEAWAPRLAQTLNVEVKLSESERGPLRPG